MDLEQSIYKITLVQGRHRLFDTCVPLVLAKIKSPNTPSSTTAPFNCSCFSLLHEIIWKEEEAQLLVTFLKDSGFTVFTHYTSMI